MGLWIMVAWLVLATLIAVGGTALALRRSRVRLESFEDSIPPMEPWDDDPAA